MAGLLRDRGVGTAAPVGLMLPNVEEFVVAYFGILRAGGSRPSVLGAVAIPVRASATELPLKGRAELTVVAEPNDIH